MRRAVLAAALPLAFSGASPASAATDAPPAVPIPQLAAAAPTIEAFAPDGWTIEDKASGELDGDGRADAAFVLRPNDPAYKGLSDGFRIDGDPRIFAVAVASGDGFRLAAQNATLIPLRTEVGGSFEGTLAVERGAVKVTLDLWPGAGGWEQIRTFAFRLAGGRLTTIGFDLTDVQRGPDEVTTTSVNYLTGKMSVAKGAIESDKDDSKVWTRLRTKHAPTIEEIGDGVAFDPTK